MPRNWLFSPLPVLILDGLGALLAGIALGLEPQGPEILLWPVLVLFQHHQVLRWRCPSLLLMGCLEASAMSWGLLVLAQQLGLDSSWRDHPWPLLLAPWFGHGAILIWTRCSKKTPCHLVGQGRARRLARQALTHTPGLYLRIAPERQGQSQPHALILPRVRFADREVQLATPWGDIPLYPEGPEEGMGRVTRRFQDLLLAGILLVLCAPLVGMLAALAALTSAGGAFHSHLRLTHHGHPFRIHKIRSMIEHAEPDGRAVWPEEGDPRITALGVVLRRFWLDEIPQLWDVIRGPMTLVGPRPERPLFVKEFARRLPNYALRHQVKAGMTGLSQVMGFTGNTSLGRRLHLDLRYIVRWTPLLDIKLLLATGCRLLVRLKRKSDR